MMTKIEMIRALIDGKTLIYDERCGVKDKYRFNGDILEYWHDGRWFECISTTNINTLNHNKVSIYTEPPKPKQVTFRVRCEKCDRVDTGMIITAHEDSEYVIECENDCYVTSDTSKQDALDALILVERIHDDVPMTDDKLNASERAIKILRAFIEGVE